jgi:hypothetical protein
MSGAAAGRGCSEAELRELGDMLTSPVGLLALNSPSSKPPIRIGPDLINRGNDPPLRDRRFADSLLEESGFELLVPLVDAGLFGRKREFANE